MCRALGSRLAELETVEENQDVVAHMQATSTLRGTCNKTTTAWTTSAQLHSITKAYAYLFFFRHYLVFIIPYLVTVKLTIMIQFLFYFEKQRKRNDSHAIKVSAEFQHIFEFLRCIMRAISTKEDTRLLNLVIYTQKRI